MAEFFLIRKFWIRRDPPPPLSEFFWKKTVFFLMPSLTAPGRQHLLVWVDAWISEKKQDHLPLFLLHRPAQFFIILINPWLAFTWPTTLLSLSPVQRASAPPVCPVWIEKRGGHDKRYLRVDNKPSQLIQKIHQGQTFGPVCSVMVDQRRNKNDVWTYRVSPAPGRHNLIHCHV